MSEAHIPSRRDLLKSGGALVVSFSLVGQLQEVLAQETPATKSLALTSVDTFLAINSTGAVTVYSGKVDLGTGVRTALAQIAAEELDVPFRNVKIVQGDTALTPDQGPTFGSLSIQIGGVQIRNACAVAKGALLDLAATRLDMKVPELAVADGLISGGGKQVSYGELIAGKAFSLTLDHQKPPATKNAKAFKIVGTSVPRISQRAVADRVVAKLTPYLAPRPLAPTARAPSSPRTGISLKWKSAPAPPAASPSARAGRAASRRRSRNAPRRIPRPPPAKG